MGDALEMFPIYHSLPGPGGWLLSAAGLGQPSSQQPGGLRCPEKLRGR